MKEEILLFIGDYKDMNNIPSLKEKVVEYLGKRMIEDDCPDGPVLKLSQSLNTTDVIGINRLVNETSGNSLSVLHIKCDSEKESSVLSGLFISLKPAI